MTGTSYSSISNPNMYCVFMTGQHSPGEWWSKPFVLYHVQYKTQSEHFLVRSRGLEDRTVSQYHDDSKCFCFSGYFILFAFHTIPHYVSQARLELALEARRMRGVHPYPRLLQAVLVVCCLTAGIRKLGNGFCFPHQFEYVHFVFLI